MTGQTFDYKPKHTTEFLKKVRENRELIMSESKIPYAELDRPMEFGDFPPMNMTIMLGSLSWEFHRDKPFNWLQVKLLKFCLGIEVTKNGT